MRNASRRQSGASPKWNERNGVRRNTVTMASAVAACLVLLIGASLAMPGIAASIQTGDYSGFETAASIFHGGAALGYIVIGLLAFLLGVCVTILCFRHPADEPGGRAGRGKRGDSWS